MLNNIRKYDADNGVTCNVARLTGIPCGNPAILAGYSYVNAKSIPIVCNICYKDIELSGANYSRQICHNCYSHLSKDICNKCSNVVIPVNLFNRNNQICECYRSIITRAQYNDAIVLCREHQRVKPANSRLRMISHYNELLNKLTKLYRDFIYYDDYMLPYECEYLYDGIVKLEHMLGLGAGEGQTHGQIVKLFEPSYTN